MQMWRQCRQWRKWRQFPALLFNIPNFIQYIQRIRCQWWHMCPTWPQLPSQPPPSPLCRPYLGTAAGGWGCFNLLHHSSSSSQLTSFIVITRLAPWWHCCCSDCLVCASPFSSVQLVSLPLTLPTSSSTMFIWKGRPIIIWMNVEVLCRGENWNEASEQKQEEDENEGEAVPEFH